MKWILASNFVSAVQLVDTEHTHGVTFIVCKMVSLLVCEDPYLEINQSAVVEKLLFIIADRTVVLL